MRAVFADTFYWVALTSGEDEAHGSAKDLEGLLRDARVVTTQEVLAEFLTFYASQGSSFRARAVATVDRILASPAVRAIPQSSESFHDGLALYRSRPDKGYSLTDCISMATMRREKIEEALTNDRHFVQEGFRALFSK